MNNLAILLREQGKLDQAEPLMREALEITRKMCPPDRFPNGHPQLVTDVNNLAFVQWGLGRPEQAEKLFSEALDMARKLYPPATYPDGHHVLARSQKNLAAFYRDQGQPDNSEPLFRDAVTMYQRLALAYADVRSEGEALTLIDSFPGKHGYLSLVRAYPSLAPRAYGTLWSSRNILPGLRSSGI